MILNTHPKIRKEMVKAISELTALESSYMGMPSCAYQIGPVTVNKDSTITCEDETVIAVIKPMLIERGWLEDDPEPETLADLKELPETENGLTVASMDITMPVEGWTVSQLINLLRMLYSKQYLINRMLDYEMLYIEEAFVTAISDNPPETAADFEERVFNAIAAEHIQGLNIVDAKVTLSTPFVQDEPTRWTAYSELLHGILKTAETATRISIKRMDDSENEKYHANSWLARMGFGGPQYKETRRILMGHLTGFAAFRSTADMEAHKARQTQRRQERRENAQGGSDEYDEA